MTTDKLVTLRNLKRFKELWDAEYRSNGPTDAELVSTEFLGQDENGGNMYKLTFSDGTMAAFTAPKGEKGDKGDTGAYVISAEVIQE